MTKKLDLLAPQPQELLFGDGTFALPPACDIHIRGEVSSMLRAAQLIQAALVRNGVDAVITARPATVSSDFVLAIDSTRCPRPESYRLTVNANGVYAVAGDLAGLFYAACTLSQLIDLHAGEGGVISLPAVHIVDWPDYAHRGVMLDITRDRVPTMQTLYALVDLLAGLKLNQFQLYTEHTFAYAGHEVVWRDASPLTGEEVLLLDAYCRERHMELVPNQNSFGHMHRWLKHDEYRHLAESPDGILHGFSTVREPYSFCPVDPGSIALLEDMYAQLLPHFASRQYNVGLDETWDLGEGRSKAVCDEKGKGTVYLDFLKQIHELVSEHGRTMQFWSDIIVRNEPELVADLPKDVIALEWGYEADYPFAEHAELIAKSGRSFYVCPGTSSWNTLAGRTDNALGNLRNAAVNGHAHGAIGYLNTDWGDNGHMQPLPVSYLGYLAGACMSWNVEMADTESEPDWPAMLDVHIFRDSGGVMGQVAYDMGLVYRLVGSRIHNSSPLFWLLILPDELPENRVPSDVTDDQFREAQETIDAAASRLSAAKMACKDADLVAAEYAWVADMLKWASRLGTARLEAGLNQPVEAVDTAVRQQLATDLAPLIERYRELWLARSRPGGLEDSAGRLDIMLERLRGN